MKKITYRFFYTQETYLKDYTITTDMGFKSALAHFCNMIAPADNIKSIYTEEAKEDTLINFLDNNPPENENTLPVKPMTKEEELAYNQGYYDAETANFKQQMIALGEWV